MSSANVVNVMIGELKVGRPPELLKATLGSCVGIAFLWPERKLYGLAHCLLPKAPPNSLLHGAKYVDQAFLALQKLMKVPSDQLGNLEVYLAGGGYMFEGVGPKGTSPTIGEQNSGEALRVAKEMQLNVKATDFGGNLGRRFIVDCATGLIEVQKIAQIWDKI